MSLIIKSIIRYAIYLALTGEIVSCTLEFREKAGHSVSNGLINLKSLNQQLHRKH